MKPHDSNEILELMDTVPNNGFIRFLDMFNSEIVTITDPKLVTEFLGVKADHFTKRPKLKKILESILGNGLVVAEGKDHKYQRKHLLPVFNFKVVKNLYPLFWGKATEMTNLIKQEIQSSASDKSSSAVIDIDDWAGRVSLDIISKAGFGSDFHALSHPETDLNTSYRAAFLPNANSRLIFILCLLTHPTLINSLPTANARILREGVGVVTKWIRGFIAQRQGDMPKEKGNKGVHQDIISAAMENGAFSVENLVDQSKTLLGAGHETSATAITWGIYLLSQPRYAHIQNRLRAEIREHLPSPSSGIPVTEDMLDKLPYLEAVSKEILRVYAPVPSLGRVAQSPVEIGGIVFPKGTVIQVHMWAINKSKKLWGEDAREFNPERWLKDKVNGGAKESLAFITFGYGSRSCIGRGFALAENKSLLAQLIGSFEIKPPRGETEDLDISWGITARMVGGLPVKTTVVEGW